MSAHLAVSHYYTLNVKSVEQLWVKKSGPLAPAGIHLSNFGICMPRSQSLQLLYPRRLGNFDEIIMNSPSSINCCMLQGPY